MAGINPSTASLTEADGRQLAVDMLRELLTWTEQIDDRVAESIGESNEMPDMRELMLSQDPEIMRRYLSTVAQSGSAELERGFLCVLSHSLANSVLESSLNCTDDEYIEPRPGLVWRAQS